jgi:hypothetical protein
MLGELVSTCRFDLKVDSPQRRQDRKEVFVGRGLRPDT